MSMSDGVGKGSRNVNLMISTRLCFYDYPGWTLDAKRGCTGLGWVALLLTTKLMFWF